MDQRIDSIVSNSSKPTVKVWMERGKWWWIEQATRTDPCPYLKPLMGRFGEPPDLQLRQFTQDDPDDMVVGSLLTSGGMAPVPLEIWKEGSDADPGLDSSPASSPA